IWFIRSHLSPAVRAGVMNLEQISRSLRAFLSANSMLKTDPASALQRFSFQYYEAWSRIPARLGKGRVLESVKSLTQLTPRLVSPLFSISGYQHFSFFLPYSIF